MEYFYQIEKVSNFIDRFPLTATVLGVLILILSAVIVNFIVKHILLRVVMHLVHMIQHEGHKHIAKHKIIFRLANIAPALLVMMGVAFIPHLPLPVILVVQNVASAFIILIVALALSSFLNIVNLLYNRRPGAHNKPIKGYLQILKIVIYLITAILVISVLIDKSPLILLSGLGAIAAVLMLVFQDTLLSLVASIQISSADMVRVGDWIEMPNLNADGDVIDIALHTVKIQNWDKTITTLPTRRLITDPFKNWRGMQESGGRRIKRALYLDQTSIHFLNDEEKHHLQKLALLSPYLDEKAQELENWNKKLSASERDAINARRLTNVGTFRAYVGQYLKNHSQIKKDMTLLVRQLSPGATGLPIEIYCFTNTVAWAEYENIQSDIFDHLYAILQEFNLRAYQQPSGFDFQKMI